MKPYPGDPGEIEGALEVTAYQVWGRVFAHLAAALAHKGPVLISGYDTTLYNDMLRGWHREETACYSQTASKKREVLWMNFEPMGQMRIEEILGVML